MRKNILILITLLACQVYVSAQEREAKREYLKPIEISEEEQNEFTGKYLIDSQKKFFIEVTKRDGVMAIVIPDIEKSKGDAEANHQYTIIAQYKDKFYLKRDEIIKIHFTRSKKTGKVISVLFNATRAKEFETIRASRSI